VFSGIVERVGTVQAIDEREQARRIRLEVGAWCRELEPGASIAVDGACLTVESVSDDSVSLTAVSTTLERTIAGGYAVGSSVNLERALRADSRLDGHLVQGHVDGIGDLVSRVPEGDAQLLRFRIPEDVAALTVEHGSIAINGVSLTVSEITGPCEVEVAMIPFTGMHTNLGSIGVGDRVNVEGDLIGKYVGRMLAPYREGEP